MHSSNIPVSPQLLSNFHTISATRAPSHIRIQLLGERLCAVSSYTAAAGADAGLEAMATIEDALKQIRAELDRAETIHVDGVPVTLTSSAPCYVIARLPTTTLWQIIYFLPDQPSAVRDRMLYASSLTSLRVGLGASLFASTVWRLGDTKDVNISEYRNVTQAHSVSDTGALSPISDDALYSSNELQELERGLGAGVSAAGGGKNVAIAQVPIETEQAAVFSIEGLLSSSASSAYNAVVLSLSDEQQVLTVDKLLRVKTSEEIQTAVTGGSPRFILYCPTMPATPAPISDVIAAIILVYLCPDAARIKTKMTYSTCKQSVVKICELHGATITHNVEISDVSELTDHNVLPDDVRDRINGSSETSQGAKSTAFSKPQRPGKGKARLIG